ncbi:hypothetical protein [Burkholderia cepacia]|uniref:hypothetical protein n=1 Tax=Burkholderia cepacia TaxID=292 RepID=UPI002ABE6955|nr:hypothetical protein [Burkholderia cepacia]
MSPAGSLIVGAIVLVPACQPRRRPSVDASPVVAIAAGTGGDRVRHLLPARADARFGRHDGAQACLRVPISIGVGMALLGESRSASAWLGLVCAVAGVAAMTLPSRQCAQPRA